MRRLAPLWHAARLDRSRGRLLALSVALAVGALLCGMALLATSGYLISRAAQEPEVLSLMVAIVAVRAFGLARAGLRYFERLASHDLALRHTAVLRARLYRGLVPLVPADLGVRPGELLARFVDDAETLRDVHLRVAIPLIVALVVSAAAAVAAWLILPAAALVAVITLLAALTLVPWLSARTAAAAGRRQAVARSDLTAELVETIDGAPELVLAGRSQERIRSLDRAGSTLGRLARRDALAAGVGSAAGQVLIGVGVVSTLVVGVAAVAEGTLAPVLLAALVLLLLGAYEAVQPLPAAARRAHTCLAAARRLDDVTATEATVTDPACPRSASGHGPLVLRGVSQRYGGGPAVLEGVDLTLDPGCRVGLRGPSGCGKTSIAELLVRFRDPDAGSITLDGVDLRDLTQHDVRTSVALAQQDAHLFNTTVRENLLVAGRELGERELWEALDVVELTGWVEGLEHGLDTLVGQEGATISGGQRQRLALARALLAPARFLVLDEPSAHLDRALANRIMGRVRAGAGDRALLVISHAPEDHVGLDVHRLSAGRLEPVEARETTYPARWAMPMPAPTV